MVPLGYHIGDLWGKQEERRPGDTEKRGAFRYMVDMGKGSAQYLSNREKIYDFKILKVNDPEIVRISGGKYIRF